MYKYSPDFRIANYESTGWRMSGSMPGYNFLFHDFWIGLSIWFLNILILYMTLFSGLRNFLTGRIIKTFAYFKISWYIALYVSLGDNYLYNRRFWLLILIILISHLFNSVFKEQSLSLSMTFPCKVDPEIRVGS